MRSRTCVRLTFFFFFVSRFHECAYEQSYVRSAHYHVPATSHLTHVPTATSCHLRPPTAPHTRHATGQGKQKKRVAEATLFWLRYVFPPSPVSTHRTHVRVVVRVFDLFLFLFLLLFRVSLTPATSHLQRPPPEVRYGGPPLCLIALCFFFFFFFFFFFSLSRARDASRAFGFFFLFYFHLMFIVCILIS